MPVWKAAERKGAKAFAKSLEHTRLQAARDKVDKPSWSAEEIVDFLADRKEDVQRLYVVFAVTKPDIQAYFRSLKPSEELVLGKVDGLQVDELKTILLSYFTQGWKGDAKAFLKERAQANPSRKRRRTHSADAGLQEEWATMTNIPFNGASRAQVQQLLQRVNEGELNKIMVKLQGADADFSGNTDLKVQAILSAVDSAGGPYKLLNAMEERHVRTFFVENWEKIAEANDAVACGYDKDCINYDVHDCQLFILWCWR